MKEAVTRWRDRLVLEVCTAGPLVPFVLTPLLVGFGLGWVVWG